MAFTKRTAKNEKLKTSCFKAPRLLVFTTLLTVLILITGCQSKNAPPEPVKPANAEPRPTVSVKPTDANSTPVVSFHDKCAGILKNYVDDKGMVDYKTLKRKKLELNHLLDEFAKLNPDIYNSWSKEDKIAFWLNAYNIKMLKIIIDNYPIQSQRILRVLWGPDSIRHIEGIWDKYKFTVMDEEFTLKEIEQRFFRKEFDEPRVFFAISCASLSSPPLRNEPYYGCRLYEQLDDQAKKFLSSPLAFRIDREKQIVRLSAIFHPTWYGEEFISKYGTDKKFKDQPPSLRAVLNLAANYISEQDLFFLERENYSAQYITYNWTLNDSSSSMNNEQ
jgi:hypothetical protein